MNFNQSIKIFVIVTLGLPVAAFSQVGANPFGPAPKTSVVAVEMTKAEALAALTSSDRAKVHSDHLTKLLDRVPNKVETKADFIIVEYVQNLITGLPSNKKLSNKELEDNQKRNSVEFKKIKQNIHNKFDITEIEIIQDYEVFPMSLISIKDKKSLIKLLKDPAIKRISKNNVGFAHLTESLPQIGQPSAQIAGFTGEGTSVVVLDTGLDYTRPAFGSCTSPGTPQSSCKVLTVGDFAVNDGALDADPQKHGTNVSGIIVGVAPNTKIIGIDIFTGSSYYDSDLFNGIQWSIINKNNYNIKAINISAGYYNLGYFSACNSFVSTVMLSARANGILPVVSSGNDTFANAISDPACASGAVSVGSVDENDVVAYDSNSSNLLTMLAPGVNINAAGITLSGTSQAAPHVAGAVAVLSAAFPNESAEEILVRITNSGVPVYDQRNGITKPRLDLKAALGNLIPSIASPVLSNNNIIPILELLLLSD